MAKTGKTKTILVIEDEVDIRNFATRVLELEGYHILQASTAEKGMKSIKGKQVSLVLLDLRLSDRNGWTLLKQLKNETEPARIPVIVFTASAGVSQQERAFSLGAAAYLVKPLSAAKLRKTVARILQDNERG